MFKSLSLTGSRNDSFSTHHQSGSQLDASTRTVPQKPKVRLYTVNDQLKPYNHVDITELLYLHVAERQPLLNTCK